MAGRFDRFMAIALPAALALVAVAVIAIAVRWS